MRLTQRADWSEGQSNTGSRKFKVYSTSYGIAPAITRAGRDARWLIPLHKAPRPMN